mgnify:CR=1 FL=1
MTRFYRIVYDPSEVGNYCKDCGYRVPSDEILASDQGFIKNGRHWKCMNCENGLTPESQLDDEQLKIFKAGEKEFNKMWNKSVDNAIRCLRESKYKSHVEEKDDYALSTLLILFNLLGVTNAQEVYEFMSKIKNINKYTASVTEEDYR